MTVQMNMQISPTIFQSTVREWYDALYRFAFSLSRNPDDAADLTQNAFYKFADKGGSINDPTKIKSWLFSVVYREYVDQFRRRGRYPESPLELVPEPAANHRPEAMADRLDSREVLHQLAKVSEKYRVPLTLFYLKSFSYKEIAATLEIPIGTVMSRLRRGKDQLRELLENGGGEEEQPAVTLEFPKKKEARNG